jgi:hypothetical protein
MHGASQQEITMTYKLTWLADVLRSAGLKVVEVDGWKTRGRAEMGNVRGVALHHTGGPANATGTPSLNLIIKGRADLAGPLSQTYLQSDGTWYVVAAGRCNHAGAGSWHGVTNGNAELIGVEAENAGTAKDLWEPEQMDAYIRGVAAILTHIKADAVMAMGHKEYATPRGRKIDPTFDMDDFRDELEIVMKGRQPVPAAIAHVEPKRAMLRKGSRGQSVTELQLLLGIRGDGEFGPATDKAVRAYQHKHGLEVDGYVGPATWKLLLEGKGKT